MKKTAYLLILLFGISTLPVELTNVSGEESNDSYTISGYVYDSEGNLAGSTSIKLSGYESIWTDSNGFYQYGDIPEGDYSIRAYFLNNGHTAVYRKVVVSADMSLDWIVNKNWITIETNDDAAQFTVTSQDSTETKSSGDLISFGPYDIGQYHSISATYSDGEVREYVMKLRSGSSNEPYLNHMVLNSQENCKFGHLTDIYDNHMPNAVISIGEQSVYTDEEGFYSICGLQIGNQYNISAHSGSIELVAVYDHLVNGNTGWYNLTSQIVPQKPEAPSFVTQSFDMVVTEGSKTISWSGGDYTEYFDLYLEDQLAYRGFSEDFVFSPSSAGTYQFRLVAVNPNGTTPGVKTLTVVVLEDPGDGFWNVGMNWSYEIDYYPASSSGTHNVTMTMVGTEAMLDAFGVEQECYLLKVVDEYDTPDRVRYHWIDTDNLLKVRTYSETSSYFVDGTMGWQYTTQGGQITDLFSGDAEFGHFNRTNIIGVPGHPNGYDDTNNTVTVTDNVLLETPSGTYLTTHYEIKDLGDDIVSWELWFNETVRNWVKIIDRLPGSHSESVTYHLSDYSGIPSQPQFVTESQTVNTKDYLINWGSFGSAMSYELFQDGESIYTGTDTSFSVTNQADGDYVYHIEVTLFSGTKISSETISIEVNYVVPVPELNLPYAQDLDTNDGLYISWSKTVEADWYSLYHTSPDGTTTEVYNGTDNFVTFSEFEQGQNRFRANLGFDGGKYSELSNSSYVNYIYESDEDSDNLSFLSTVAVLTIVLIAVGVRDQDGD